MSMGSEECNYNIEKSKRKCKCGKGFVREIWHVTEESCYPPFEKEYTVYYECDCPDHCEIF